MLQDALSEVTKIYPPLKLRVFVDDITALLMENNEEVAEMAKHVMKRLREEVGEKGLKLSVNENGKDGKSEMIVSCGFLEDEVRQCCKEGGVTMRARVKNLGAKEKARRKKCTVRFSLMKVGGKKMLRAKMMSARTWRAHAEGMAPTERLKLRRQMAAAGKKSTTSLSLFMEAYGLEVEEELSTLATQYWAQGVWHHEQREAWMKQVREVQVWRQVRGPAGAVMCETRDLGIKWPH